MNAELQERGNAVNQKKKKAFALTQQDRELIPSNIEQPHVFQIDSITGEKKISYGIENCGAAIGIAGGLRDGPSISILHLHPLVSKKSGIPPGNSFALSD